MNVIHPDQSLVNILERIVSADSKYRLFTNNVTLNQATVLADFTEQGSGDGYAAITVAAADYTLSGVTGHNGSLVAPDISFTPSTGTGWDIYGYYETDTAGTKLLKAAKFDGGPIHVNVGESIIVTPKWANASKFAS